MVVCFAHLQEDVKEDKEVINICISVWVSGRGGLVWTAGSEESCWYVWDVVAYWHHPHTPTHLWPVLLPLVLVRLMDQNVTVYSNRKKGGHIFGIRQIWWKNNKHRKKLFHSMGLILFIFFASFICCFTYFVLSKKTLNICPQLVCNLNEKPGWSGWT